MKVWRSANRAELRAIQRAWYRANRERIRVEGHKPTPHLRGRKFTEEHKRRISEALKGKHPTAEHRARLSQGQRKRWSRLSPSQRRSFIMRLQQARPRWSLEKEEEFRSKNPYSSETSPREYSAWYHQHHPGYYARKTREWLERQPPRRRKTLVARWRRKSQAYINAYNKLRRRLDHHIASAPSFTADEINAIRKSDHLTNMYRRVHEARDMV